MNSKERIAALKKIPLTWKELDIITSAERYLIDAIDLPMVKFTFPCFPKIDKEVIEKIAAVWRYNMAALHLQKEKERLKATTTLSLLDQAKRIYEQEAQRILGSIFSLEHPFWKAFYQRQESDLKKPLVAIDALHFYTNCEEKIAYQLLIQSLKAILKAQYETDNNIRNKNEHFENANRLLINLPLDDLKNWLQTHKINSIK